MRRLLRLRRGFPLDFPNEHRLQIARGIWVGVAYLHSRQILHRDIKPANILIRFGSKVHTVLADMGLATNMSMPSVFAGRDAEKKRAGMCLKHQVARYQRKEHESPLVGRGDSDGDSGDIA